MPVDKKIGLCVLTALFTAGGAIISQPLGCSSPNLCAPRVLTTCPRKNPIPECPTCCCKTSENAEFYDPDRPEPWCTAPPAVYTVKFVGTWSRTCQPDYYPSGAHWSPPTGASHNTNYRMWDACMDNPSPGVAQVSQTGATRFIEQEYVAAGDNILDTFKADGIPGFAMTSRDLIVDKTHQWVSVVTMIAPSRDRMVGVPDLRLCDGYDWKKSVKVCTEAFSTATRSARVHDPMQRNSIQRNNCSFGYFEFTFKQYNDTTQEPPVDCEYDSSDVCPPVKDHPENCRTCCCKSSDNVDFFHPGATQIPCGATDTAKYKVSLIPKIGPICHHNFPFVGGMDSAYFSGLLMFSDRAARVINKCMEGIRLGVASTLVVTEETLDEVRGSFKQHVDGGIFYDAFVAADVLNRPKRKRRTGFLNVSPSRSHVTLISKLMPSENQWVGFSGLNMCGPSGWKDRVEVCLLLQAAVNRTAFPEAESKLQGNHCSFGRVLLERRPKRDPTTRTSMCKPHDESVFSNPNFALSACCACEFIIEGQIIRVIKRYGDARYSHDLKVRVTAVHYDDIEHIEVGDVVNIKVCSLRFRIKFKRTYRLTGARECGSNELEISETGILANIPELGDNGPLGVGPCAPYIRAGNCDD